jgi:hypothetical protein
MNYSKIITTGLGFLLGLVVYHFVKKALNGNGSVSVVEEESASAIGLGVVRRPGVLKASGGTFHCECRDKWGNIKIQRGCRRSQYPNDDCNACCEGYGKENARQDSM